jgi:hypothetical protein
MVITQRRSSRRSPPSQSLGSAILEIRLTGGQWGLGVRCRFTGLLSDFEKAMLRYGG